MSHIKSLFIHPAPLNSALVSFHFISFRSFVRDGSVERDTPRLEGAHEHDARDVRVVDVGVGVWASLSRS